MGVFKGRTISLAVGLLLFLLNFENVLTKPIDSRAVKELSQIDSIMANPRNKEKLPDSLLNKYHRIIGSENVDLKIVALIGLAYSEDDSSLILIQKASESKNEIIKGAADYAKIMRKCAKKNRTEILDRFLKKILESQNPFEKVFLINRLALDFGDTALIKLINYVSNENSDIVKYDLLYHLSESNSFTLLQKALELKINDYVMPENIEFILSSISHKKKGKIGSSQMLRIKIEDKVKKFK